MNDQNPVDPNAPVAGVPGATPVDTTVPGTAQDAPVVGGDNPAPTAAPEVVPTPEPLAPVEQPATPVPGTGDQPAA